MIRKEKRILSSPGGSYSITIPKQWIEENLKQNQEGKYEVWCVIDGKVITITPMSWQYRTPVTIPGGIKTPAHSAPELLAQRLRETQGQPIKEEPAP